MERDALLNGSSIKGKEMDIKMLQHTMEDGHQSDKLTYLKGSNVEDEDTKAFPQFNEEA